ncbi:hypothetical protein HOI83_04510 [Candidatus Uhrbacteria bacterium]|jgi:hypothetical protein|nr:hypothetical protein [Candidatus Uhrbacteria bacterium]
MMVIEVDFLNRCRYRAGSSSDDGSSSPMTGEGARRQCLLKEILDGYGASEEQQAAFMGLSRAQQRATVNFVNRMVEAMASRRQFMNLRKVKDLTVDESRMAGLTLTTFLHLQGDKGLHVASAFVASVNRSREEMFALRLSAKSTMPPTYNISREERDMVLRVADGLILATLLRWAAEDEHGPTGQEGTG